MKRIVLLAALGFAVISCDDAASKIENDNPNGAASMEQAATPNTQQTQQQNQQMNQQQNQATPANVDAENAPAFAFNNEKHDFGTIQQGDKPETEFEFTNTGKSPLIITQARGSCGCTVPEWPNEPIAPGETGKIKVIFDSTGKSGRQSKTVTLTANTVPNTKVLTITADIETPQAQ
jgi:hypothetical protein